MLKNGKKKAKDEGKTDKEKLSNKSSASKMKGKGPFLRPKDDALSVLLEGDKRFSNVTSLPIFRSVPKREKKVTIDQRFQGMFSDTKFQADTKIDKRGRRLNVKSTDNLMKYYNLDEEETVEGAEEEEVKEKVDEKPEGEESSTSSDSEGEGCLDEEDSLLPELKNRKQPGISDEVRQKLRNINVDYARGEAPLLSADEGSDDSDSSSTAGEEEEDVDHGWGELDKEAPTTEASTNRLALCNMDWDRIKAQDLMVLFSSFLPPGGRLLRASIYPSEFGKKRMAEEVLKGPLELTSGGGIKIESVPNTKDEQDFDGIGRGGGDDEFDVEEADEDEDEFHREKLRQYQLNRLKYFYAVLEFDSIESAEKIYEECDGREYESSAAKIDLRYIPDDMKFDEEESNDVSEGLANPAKYQPKFFTTTALQQVKVNCTWDETDPSRKDLIDRVFNAKDTVDDDDLKNYLAASSDEEEEEEDGEQDEEKKGN
jgi:hypothetical protein